MVRFVRTKETTHVLSLPLPKGPVEATWGCACLDLPRFSADLTAKPPGVATSRRLCLVAPDDVRVPSGNHRQGSRTGAGNRECPVRPRQFTPARGARGRTVTHIGWGENCAGRRGDNPAEKPRAGSLQSRHSPSIIAKRRALIRRHSIPLSRDALQARGQAAPGKEDFCQ